MQRDVGLLSDDRRVTLVESYTEVAGRLSSMLLDLVATQLKGKRLLIVGDRALQQLPFGASIVGGIALARFPPDGIEHQPDRGRFSDYWETYCLSPSERVE